MKTKQYTTIDRSKWPSGAWDGEPDKIQWPDSKTGLPCLAVRHPQFGHWCGYVGVSEGHPQYSKAYGDVNAEVHGGLTFANMCQPHETEDTGICHVPEKGEPNHVWWFGFDCAHYSDSSPTNAFPPGNYRTLDYVKEQCTELARQLKEQAKQAGE